MNTDSTDLLQALNFRDTEYRFGQFDLVKRLLDRGRNPNTPNAFGLYPLHAAIHPFLVRLLLDSGADIDVQCSHGMTALHRAVINGHVEIAQILLAAGIDRTIRDKHGKTARRYIRQRIVYDSRYTASAWSPDITRQLSVLFR